MCNILNLSSLHSLTLSELLRPVMLADWSLSCTHEFWNRIMSTKVFFYSVFFHSSASCMQAFSRSQGKYWNENFNFPFLNLLHRTWLHSLWSWGFSFCWVDISLTQVKRRCLSLRIWSNWILNFYDVWWSMNTYRFDAMGMSTIMMIYYMSLCRVYFLNQIDDSVTAFECSHVSKSIVWFRLVRKSE